MTRLIDSHCHLNLTDKFASPEKVHAEMLEADVDSCVVIGIDLETSQIALDLAKRYDWIHASTGIHPCTTNFTDSEAEWATLTELAQKATAVGETGLDAYHDRLPMDAQKPRFIRHLELARDLRKPVVVHCRDADDACIDVLKTHGDNVIGVLHCWAGGLELAQTAMDRGWFVSLAGNLTFKNAQSLREAAATIPLDRLLVETDSPFLSPHPHRGKDNHPARTSLVADCLASVKNVDREEIVAVTRRNTLQLFQLSNEEGPLSKSWGGV